MATPAGVTYDPTSQQYVSAPTVAPTSYTFDQAAADRQARKNAAKAAESGVPEGDVAAANPPPAASPPPTPTVAPTSYTFDKAAADRAAAKAVGYASQEGVLEQDLMAQAGQQLFYPGTQALKDAAKAAENVAATPYVREDQETGAFQAALPEILSRPPGHTGDTGADAAGSAAWYDNYVNNFVYGPGGLAESAGSNLGPVLQAVSDYVIQQLQNSGNDPMLKQQMDQFAIAAEAMRSEIQAAASRSGDPNAQAAMIAQGEANILDRFGKLMAQQSEEKRKYVLDLIQTATGTAGVELGQNQLNEQSKQFYANLSQEDQQFFNKLSTENQQFIAGLNQDQQQFLLTYGLQSQQAKDAMTRWNAELQWDKDKTAQINALDWQKFSAQFNLSKQEFGLKLQQFAQDQANWKSTFEFDEAKFQAQFNLSKQELEATLGIKMEELALNRLQVESQIDNADWDSIRGDIELLMEQENVDGAGLLTAQLIGSRLYGPNTPEYEEFVANATQGYVVGLSGGTWAYLATKVKSGADSAQTVELMGHTYDIRNTGKSGSGTYDLYADGAKVGTWDGAAGMFVVDDTLPFVKNVNTQDGELVGTFSPEEEVPAVVPTTGPAITSVVSGGSVAKDIEQARERYDRYNVGSNISIGGVAGTVTKKLTSHDWFKGSDDYVGGYYSIPLIVIRDAAGNLYTWNTAENKIYPGGR